MGHWKPTLFDFWRRNSWLLSDCSMSPKPERMLIGLEQRCGAVYIQNMILFNEGNYYIEHGSRRKGVYNAQVKVSDKGKRDYQMSRVYDAERALDAGATMAYPHPTILHSVTCGLIDNIVGQDEYVRLFGSTRLLIEFSKRRTRSEAFRLDQLAKISFPETGKIYLYDIYHELAHCVTLLAGEPSHGERFAGAFLAIAHLSPWESHGRRAESRLPKFSVALPENIHKFVPEQK